MKTINTKLWRNIWFTKTQFAAVVMVMAIGIAVLVAMTTAHSNLYIAQQKFYNDNNFADHYFGVIRAPQRVIQRIAEVDGVAQVSGRIQKEIPLIKTGNARASVMVCSYNLPCSRDINRFVLKSGVYPAGGADERLEVLANEAFAKTNKLVSGAELRLLVDGRQFDVEFCGTFVAPEFVYAVQQGAIMPDDSSFGVLLLPLEAAQRLFGMRNEINQIIVKWKPGCDKKTAVERIKLILQPYGCIADFARKKQLSNQYLDNEILQLQNSSYDMPLIFLLIGAGVQFVIIRRLVNYQRGQIGVMKALGYSDASMMILYGSYALAVAFTASIIGGGGGYLLSSYISGMYAEYFHLPAEIGGFNAAALALGALICIAVSVCAAFLSTRKVIHIAPAEAMRVAVPVSGRHTLFERWQRFWCALNSDWRMTLRSIGRNKARFLVTVFGVAGAVAVLLTGFFNGDAVSYMMYRHYQVDNKYDYCLRFSDMQTYREHCFVGSIPGIERAEPILEIPVKILYGSAAEDELLIGVEKTMQLKRLDATARDHLDEGIVLSKRVADKFGINVGAQVLVETKLDRGEIKRGNYRVVAISEQLIANESYMDIVQAARLLGVSYAISGELLHVEPHRRVAVVDKLNSFAGVASLSDRLKELNQINEQMRAMLFFTLVTILFACGLGFTAIYNSSLVTFHERQRELATLMVIGYSRWRLNRLLLYENLIQVIIGVALGLPFGYLIAYYYSRAISNDMFTLPLIIYPRSYFYAAVGAVIFSAVSFMFICRKMKQLNLVEQLKCRE